MSKMKLNLLFLIAIAMEGFIYFSGLKSPERSYGMKPIPNVEAAFRVTDGLTFYKDESYADLHLRNMTTDSLAANIPIPEPTAVTDKPIDLSVNEKHLDSGISKKPAAEIVSSKKPISAVSSDIQSLISKYAIQYNVNSDLLTKIAKCESGFNPQAVNGPFAGMYQFITGTWISNRKSMGLDPDPNLRFNAEEAIKTAAFKISKDGAGAWPVCSRV